MRAPLVGALVLFSSVAVADVIAILPVQDRAGDRDVAVAVERTLGTELRDRGELVDPGRARHELRRLRIRNADRVPEDLLRELARRLGADSLVAATVHDADRRGMPRLTVSARAYSGATGEPLWAGFESGSGLDTRKPLDLGTIYDIVEVAPNVVRRLTDDLARSASAARPPAAAGARGTWALVPFDSQTERRRTANAETVTEATRAALYRLGLQLVSPGCAGEVLRHRQAGLWGGVSGEARAALQRECGADAILTGSVGTYDVGGFLEEPEPWVALDLRTVDPATGTLSWAGQAERTGFDRETLFRSGRVYTRGELAGRMIDALARRLLKARTRAAEREERR